MIWLTWRQHRRQVLFTGIVLAALAALMISTGLAMRRAFVDTGLQECIRKLGGATLAPFTDTACDTAYRQFTNEYDSWVLVGVLFVVLPLLVGLFWGAPLVAREVEHGTHRLVWTQGVSRRHWATTKFGFVCAATLAAAVVYGLGLSWWSDPLLQASRQSRFNAVFFDMQGFAPVGYTLFAVALGIFAGTVWPKVLPAMAVTLVGFIGLRVAVAILARPRYLPAHTRTFPVEGFPRASNVALGDWVVSSGIRNADGTLVVPNAEIVCPLGAEGPGGGPCGADLGVKPGAYNWQLYQPADRFWLFQGIETGIFVALAALLLYLALRRIRHLA